MQLTNLTRRNEIGANSYLLEIAGHRVLLDAGMHPREMGNTGLPHFAAAPEEGAEAIFLTHSHQDHLGALPVAMRRFPRALAFMTEAARRLSEVMLHNSANVMIRQREEGGPPELPMFTHREVDGCARRFVGVPLGQRFDLTGERLGEGTRADVEAQLLHAGHILGAAAILLRGEGQTLLYTGDVHFEDQTLTTAAELPGEGVDILVMETTRGDTPAPEGYSRTAESARLAAAMNTVFDRGGAVLIPVFALGKTQELLAMLHGMREQGDLPLTPLYIGGLGTKLSEIYDKLARDVPRKRPELQLLDHIAPFVVSGADAGSTPIKPRRIYALSSGMMTENTISNQFARRILEQPEHGIFFVGYADPESPAGKLRATPRGGKVALDKRAPEQTVACEVDAFQFSGHASRESLLAYATKLRPKTVLLVHGDPPALAWFQARLSESLPETRVIIPAPGEPVTL